VIDHDYVFKNPIFGGELSFHNNLISLSRDSVNFDRSRRRPSPTACASPTTADPAVINSNNCLLRGVPGEYPSLHRVELKRTVIDQWGQMFTPSSSCAPILPT
jgi:LPS-assembly protein